MGERAKRSRLDLWLGLPLLILSLAVKIEQTFHQPASLGPEKFVGQFVAPAVDDDPYQTPYRAGVALVRSGQYALGIEPLEAALKFRPTDPDANYYLASALVATKRWPEGWRRLRHAWQGMKEDLRVQTLQVNIWQRFEDDGRFDIGQPAGPLAEFLGKPDRVVPLDRRERWWYGVVAVDVLNDKVYSFGHVKDLYEPTRGLPGIIDVRGTVSLATMDNAGPDGMGLLSTDAITKLAQFWRPWRRKWSGDTETTIYLLRGEEASNWSHQFAITRIRTPKNSELTPRMVMLNLQSNARKQYPNVRWTTHRELDEESYFEWIIPETTGVPGQHEIIRALAVPNGVLTIVQSAKGQADPDAQAKSLIEQDWLR